MENKKGHKPSPKGSLHAFLFESESFIRKSEIIKARKRAKGNSIALKRKKNAQRSLVPLLRVS